jgi:hypothetical protein
LAAVHASKAGVQETGVGGLVQGGGEVLGLGECQGHAPADGRVGVERGVAEQDNAARDGAVGVGEAAVAVFEAGHGAQLGDGLPGVDPGSGDGNGGVEAAEAVVGAQRAPERVLGGNRGQQGERAVVGGEGREARPDDRRPLSR